MVLDVVISRDVESLLAGMGRVQRRLTRTALSQLGRPDRFLAMRPLVGRGPRWLATDVGPYRASCRLLRETEARKNGANHPALYVATLDRKDDLRETGRRLSDVD